MEAARTEADIRRRYKSVGRTLDERQRRLRAAAEAKTAGTRGISLVHRATGLARSTIRRGLADLKSAKSVGTGRVRRAGAGRPSAEDQQPGLRAALDALVEPSSRGDPESPLRWSCKGVRRLAHALTDQGFSVGRQKVSELLHAMGYSLQGNRKTQEGKPHPDRNAQFEHIATRTAAFQSAGDPVVSVDTKKKELVGISRTWGMNGDPVASRRRSRFTTSSISNWVASSRTA